MRVSVASSVDGSLFTVFLGELLGILNEFRTIFAVFLCQVGPQWMLWLRGGHQTNETLKHLRREGTRIYVIFIFMTPCLHNFKYHKQQFCFLAFKKKIKKSLRFQCW